MGETIIEIAEREASAAEAEHPDDDGQAYAEGEGEVEVEAEAAPPKRKRRARRPEQDEDEALEAMGHALDLEGERHAEAVAEILGDEMDGLRACPLCVTPGYVSYPPPDPFDPMQRAAVLVAMGENAPEVLKAHEKLYRCDTCDGWGDLSTGARRDVNLRVQCPDCGGKGYRNKDEDAALATVQASAPPIVAAPVASPSPGAPPGTVGHLVTQGGHTFALVAGGSPDPIGRLPGHPLWGYDASLGGL